MSGAARITITRDRCAAPEESVSQVSRWDHKSLSLPGITYASALYTVTPPHRHTHTHHAPTNIAADKNNRD